MRNIAIFVCVVSLLFSTAALAQDDQRGFGVQNFNPAPGYDSFLTLEGARVMPGKFEFLGGVLFDYQYKPLMVRDCLERSGETCIDWADQKTALIKHHLSMDLLAAMSFFGVFEFGLGVPVILHQSGDSVSDPATNGGIDSPSSSVGLGDIRMHLKLDVLRGVFGYDKDLLSLAIIPVVGLPTGNAVASESFMGDSSISIHPKLAGGIHFEDARIGVNIGYLWRETQEFYMASVGPRITYGSALEVFFGEQISGILEVFGSGGFEGDVTEAPLEADLAAKYRLKKGFWILGGMGAGIIAGVGNPAVRVLLGAGYVNPVKEKPVDRDGDGLLDIEDECPLEPEDVDNFEDEDGCPDPDNDGDGVLDREDECPLEPEDMDEFEDENGCPDPDNDKDSILDAEDECPIDAEDLDEFEDENGCPDPDNDGDGVLDLNDQCPLEPEVMNDHLDDDGCPDEKPRFVEIKEGKIELLQKIHFKTNSDEIVKKVSFNILDEVSSILKTNEKMVVVIEGHTDNRGKRKHNLDLSGRRAGSVLKYLVEKGVKPDMLTAKGLGPDRPIEDNKTEVGRTANRRVEFHIVE